MNKNLILTTKKTRWKIILGFLISGIFVSFVAYIFFNRGIASEIDGMVYIPEGEFKMGSKGKLEHGDDGGDGRIGFHNIFKMHFIGIGKKIYLHFFFYPQKPGSFYLVFSEYFTPGFAEDIKIHFQFILKRYKSEKFLRRDKSALVFNMRGMVYKCFNNFSGQ